MLALPSSAKSIDTPIIKVGFDDVGILYIIYKEAPVRTLEEAMLVMQEIKELVGNKKVCIAADVTYVAESCRDIRNYMAEEIPTIAKAIAVVSDSAVGKMMANLFFSLRPQPFPVKIFTDQAAAKMWLMKYL